jgi:putative DNA primase/helicase
MKNQPEGTGTEANVFSAGVDATEAARAEGLPTGKMMSKPQTHCDDLAQLPTALLPLTDERHWVNWCWDKRVNGTGEVKWTKPPFSPRSFNLASSKDKTSWDDYESALRRVKDGDADGIGYMLLGSNIGAVDLDHCCQEIATTRKIRTDQWARELCDGANGAYREVTVSGQGQRIIGIAQGSALHRKFKVIPESDASIELYRDTPRFITISGLQLGQCEKLPNIDDFLDQLNSRYDRNRGSNNSPRLARGMQAPRTSADYDDLIRRGATEGQRSELFHACVLHLANKGYNADEIEQQLARHPNGIGQRYIAEDRLDREVRRSYEKFERESNHPRPNLPVISVAEGEIARAVDQAHEALVAAKIPVFVRGGRLVEPVSVPREAAGGRTIKVTVFREMDEPKLAYVLNKRAAHFTRYDGRKRKAIKTDPPAKVVKGLLALRQWHLPEVAGTIAAPTLRPDGSILSAPGYDAATRLWCDSTVELPPIPDKPTRREADQALECLKDLFSGFPFESELDESVALAALLTAVLRPSFPYAPMIGVWAHSAGTGKSYLVDVIANITTGRNCPVVTGSKTPEEMEKRLGALLLEGVTLASLDNLSHDLTGDLLAQMLTQNPVKIRRLGKSEMPECDWVGVLYATGNNVRVVGDNVRRTLSCYLDANMERPELRKFKFDPVQRVRAERGKYIGSAIVIAKAYAAGVPKRVTPLAGFAEWSRWVREPLIWLGCVDPIKSIEIAHTLDPERSATREFLQRLEELVGPNEPLTAAEIIKLADELRSHGRPIYLRPKFRALLLQQAGDRRGDGIDAVRLGKWLQQIHGRVFDGRRLDLEPNPGRANLYVLKVLDGDDNMGGITNDAH